MGNPSGVEKTVLVVDDEPMVLKLVGKMLTQQGYKVLEAPDGDSALSICTTEPGTIDLLVTDIDMPGMDGRELARCLGRHKSGIPILFMTGQNLESKTSNILANAPELDGHQILWKPFRSDQLNNAVRKLLAS